jgi:hypothetical protein
MNDVPKAPPGFDVVAWREQLLELNPWARALTIDKTDEAFIAARQVATLERHAQGEEAWNTWANGMLALKKTLQEAGGWWAIDEYSQGENAETRLWLALAAAVFSTEAHKHTFDGAAQFIDFVFPANSTRASTWRARP